MKEHLLSYYIPTIKRETEKLEYLIQSERWDDAETLSEEMSDLLIDLKWDINFGKEEHVKVTAMLHSKGQIEEVEIIGKNYTGWDGTVYIVLTKDGVKCTAIYNPFVGIYYADDIYGIIKED